MPRLVDLMEVRQVRRLSVVRDGQVGKAWAPGSTIDVLVRDGVVTLNGTVAAEQVREAVRVAAENALGAVRVWDNLQVGSVPAD